MRTSTVNKIKGLGLTGYKIANELPFSDGGAEMYLRNPKTIYVDRATSETTQFLSTLDSLDIPQTTKSITAYFTTDAKNPPADYDSTVNSLLSVKNLIELAGANSREAFVSTDYVGDLLVTEVEYRLTRIN